MCIADRAIGTAVPGRQIPLLGAVPHDPPVEHATKKDTGGTDGGHQPVADVAAGHWPRDSGCEYDSEQQDGRLNVADTIVPFDLHRRISEEQTEFRLNLMPWLVR